MLNNRRKVCFYLGGREGGGAAAAVLLLLKTINKDKFEVRATCCEDGPYTKQLRDAGVQCDVLDTGWPPPMRRSVCEATKKRWQGFVLIPFWFFQNVVALVGYIRKNKIDIVHTNYLHFHFIAALACKFTRCKCVWHWRGVMGTLYWEKLKCLRGIVRWFSSQFTWSIANSQITADSARRYAGDRLSIIYDSIEIDRRPHKRGQLRKILGAPAGTRVVGYVGSLVPLKGHKYFIEAASKVCAKYNDVYFVSIGGQTAAGQQEYVDFLKSRVSELKLDGRVHFLGHRSDAFELTADFDIATVCTLPPGESFGLVTIEAMLQSVPVISTNEGASREIIIHGESGLLVPAADSDALVRAITTLLDDDEMRRKMGAAGRRRCVERFDIRKTVREVERTYEVVLSQ
jgi:glycosyltransferase involved in cell wall biosynthesis